MKTLDKYKYLWAIPVAVAVIYAFGILDGDSMHKAFEDAFKFTLVPIVVALCVRHYAKKTEP